MANQILNEQDKARIEEALKNIETAKEEIKRAKAAGIDVTEEEQKLLDAEKRLKAIYKVYFAK